MTTLTDGRASVENGELWYEVAGEGPALVLAHAGATDSRIWDDVVADLRRDHRVIRFDARGHGRSTSIAGDYSPAADLVALLDHLGVEEAVVVGSSLGGLTGIDLALDHPGKVRALALVGSGLNGHDPMDDAARWQCRTARAAEEALRVAGAGGDPTAAVAELVEIIVAGELDGPRRSPDQVDPAVRARFSGIVLDAVMTHYRNAGGILPTGAADRLADLAVPTLVMIGSLDFADLHHVADLVAGRAPHARKVVVDGVGHLPMLEAPDGFLRELRALLGADGRV